MQACRCVWVCSACAWVCHVGIIELAEHRASKWLDISAGSHPRTHAPTHPRPRVTHQHLGRRSARRWKWSFGSAATRATTPRWLSWRGRCCSCCARRGWVPRDRQTRQTLSFRDCATHSFTTPWKREKEKINRCEYNTDMSVYQRRDMQTLMQTQHTHARDTKLSASPSHASRSGRAIAPCAAAART